MERNKMKDSRSEMESLQEQINTLSTIVGTLMNDRYKQEHLETKIEQQAFETKIEQQAFGVDADLSKIRCTHSCEEHNVTHCDNHHVDKSARLSTKYRKIDAHKEAENQRAYRSLILMMLLTGTFMIVELVVGMSAKR